MSRKRSYGGRHPLHEEERKSEVIRVRLTKYDAESIRGLYDKSYAQNFSKLVRKVLFGRPIKVQVRNADVSELIRKVGRIEDDCTRLLKSRRKDLTDHKQVIEEMRREIADVKSAIDGLETANLYLTDLRDIDESERKRYYPFYSWE